MLIGVSYGFFITTEESKEQTFTTGTLAVDYQKKTNVINLKDMYPMTNRQGMNLESHEFTVKNNGNMKAKYLVRLELKTNEKKMVDLKYIRMTYSKNNGPYSTPILLSELESNLVFVKDQEILAEATDKYAIKMWIDKDAPNEIQGKEFSARIVVDSIQESEENYDMDTIPVIYLNTDEQGNKDITIKTGTEYVELGVKKVEDDKDNLSINDVTKSYEYYNPSTEELETVSEIDIDQVGIYYVTYSIEDSHHNIGKAVRVVNIMDKVIPRIELVGQESIILEENDTYIEEGVSVDNHNKVTIIGEVKTEVIGVYTVRYIVVDENNNIKGVVRTITVNEKPEAPEISGGTASWVAVAPTISLTKEGKATSGVKEYEYYKVTSETTPVAPTKATVATGTLNKENTDLTIEDEGTTYVYYRTISKGGFKSTWSSPQVVNLGTKLTDKIFGTLTPEEVPVLPDSSFKNTSEANNENGLYKTNKTNSGNFSYYYRGEVNNNWVRFAHQNWRIVRINEDGTIRLILDSNINKFQHYMFNSNHDNYQYMYYSLSDSARPELESWYDTIIKQPGFENKIALPINSYFCEQPKVKFQETASSGVSNSMILYSEYTPSLRCETVDGHGFVPINNSSINPNIGLLTYDEAVFAGGIFDNFSESSACSFYLRNWGNWYLMSPAGFSHDNYSFMWSVSWVGSFSVAGTSYDSGVGLRPVINLKSGILVTGTGEQNNKYVVR